MAQLAPLYDRYAGIWDDFSRQWLEHRRTGEHF